jgi:hypothetical protein
MILINSIHCRIGGKSGEKSVSFRKFKILNTKNSSSSDLEEIEILFNLDHIISIKPIRIVKSDKIINGFWIRTSNGKKYRASTIPNDLLELIGEKYQGSISISLDTEDQPFQ